MSFRRFVDRDEARARLRTIFPPAAFDTVLSNPLAATAITAMLYVGAVVPDGDDDADPENVWVRPASIYNLSNEALHHNDDDSRAAWAKAEASSTRKVAELLSSWGENHRPWYASGTRETLRDEIWPGWYLHDAVRRKAGVLTTSSHPRWALRASFAELFHPDLRGNALDDAIEIWRDSHMDPGDVLKISRAQEIADARHEVSLHLPGGGHRSLQPGPASLILKGVVEEWAPAALREPFVVAISEPGDKTWAQETAILAKAGISINVSSVLPDAIIVDIGVKPVRFWIIEAVASDGEVNEGRKADLLAWAQDQYINPAQCSFLSAFTSRNSAPAKRRLKDLAVGTYAWFLAEPSRELIWHDIS